jgi:FkbM family methyltransferase
MHTSAREMILRTMRSSPLVTVAKRAVPDFVKTAVIAAIARGEEGRIDLGDGVTLSYPLDDFYWSRVADNIRDYEPEIWFVLDRFMNPETLFLDCGANIGLWSCYAALKAGHGRRVIAVEPGFKVYPHLQQNCRRNNLNFTVLRNAIWSRSGESRVFFAYEGHASSSLVEDRAKKLLGRVDVETVSIDDAVESALETAPGVSDIIVKLDVEGVECQAIAGAERTLVRENALLIYEDHGSELASPPTEFCLQKGLHVYYYAGGLTRRIGNTREAGALKKNRGKGYNFFACKPGTGFDAQLRALAAAVPA